MRAPLLVAVMPVELPQEAAPTLAVLERQVLTASSHRATMLS